MAEFYRVVADAPGITATQLGNVTTFVSGIPHPLLNGIVAQGPFAPGSEQAGVDEAVTPLQADRVPFLWWCGPSAWTETLDRALAAQGVHAEVLPGMHHRLDAIEEPPLPPGTSIRRGDLVPLDEFTRVMVTGFGLPEELVDGFTGVLAHFDPARLVNAVATLDGEPVGCGSLWVTDRTGGLYNIATFGPARRRGIGFAVTATLLAMARDRGCEESVLVASELGEPVYRRLGFEQVCQIREYLWTPS